MKKKQKKNKPLLRAVTLIMGLGFAGSTLAIALSGAFSQNNHNASEYNHTGEAPSVEEQIELQASGYEKVLAREPKNIAALEGLAQIYLQTGNPEKAIPALEKLVEYYPERQEYASVLELVKQGQVNQSAVEEQPQAEETK